MRLVDWQIAQLQKNRPVIDPFEAALIREDVTYGRMLPYGLVSDGYILRLSQASAVVSYRGTVDPKRSSMAVEVSGLNFIPQQSCMLGVTIEAVHLPLGFLGRLELVHDYGVCGLHLVAPEILGADGGHPVRAVFTIVNPLSVPVWLYYGEGAVKLTIEEAPLGSRRAGEGLELEGYHHA